LSRISRIGLGTVQFGLPYGISNKTGQPDKNTVLEVLDLARSHDISLLDTASAYGTAELLLGQLGTTGFRIVSKYTPPESNISIDEQLHTSLEMMQCESLYGYLSHRPQNLLRHPEQWDALKNLKNEGFVKKIGFSLNEPAELDALLEAGFQPDLIQLPVNYFDRRFLPYFDDLKSNNTEIHARSIYLQGLFFLNEFSDRFNPVEDVIRNLQAEVSRLPAALLNFVLSDSRIDQVVIGVQNNDQLLDVISDLDQSENLPELNLSISDDILMPSKWSH
jgi:aryl-alcohol dehydrogenase-like predicted oxidoreductase